MMNLRRNRKKRFTPGRWAVERERGRIASPVQPPADHIPIRIGDAVEDVLRGLHLGEMDWQAEMFESWVELAGRTVARHARPGKMGGTCLTVFVDSPVWLAELARVHRATLLKALQSRFGATRIATLRFAPDPDGLAVRPPPTSGA
jgi:hypothetical protein